MSYFEKIRDRQNEVNEAIKSTDVSDGKLIALASINANLILLTQMLAIIADTLTTEEGAEDD